MSKEVKEIGEYKVGNIIIKNSNLSKWEIVKILYIDYLFPSESTYSYNIEIKNISEQGIDEVQITCLSDIKRNYRLVRNNDSTTVKEVQDALDTPKWASVKKGIKVKCLSDSTIYVIKDINVQNHLNGETTTDYVLEKVSKNNSGKDRIICSLSQINNYYALVKKSEEPQIAGYVSSEGISIGDFFLDKSDNSIWEVSDISARNSTIRLKSKLKDTTFRVTLEYFKANYIRVCVKEPSETKEPENVKEPELILVKTALVFKNNTIQACSYMGTRLVNKQLHSLGSRVDSFTFLSNEVEESKIFTIVKYSFSYVNEDMFEETTFVKTTLKFEKATGYLKSSIINENSVHNATGLFAS